MAFSINTYQEYEEFIDRLHRENRKATEQEIHEVGLYILRQAQLPGVWMVY
jgi:hypothetical protein